MFWQLNFYFSHGHIISGWKPGNLVWRSAFCEPRVRSWAPDSVSMTRLRFLISRWNDAWYLAASPLMESKYIYWKWKCLIDCKMHCKCSVLLFSIWLKLVVVSFQMTRENSYHFSAGLGSPTEEKSEPTSGRNTALSKSAAKEKGSR